jgi:hypothetical protein
VSHAVNIKLHVFALKILACRKITGANDTIEENGAGRKNLAKTTRIEIVSFISSGSEG